MILPPECVPPRVAAVVWAVARGADSVRQVADACDLASLNTTHRALRDARRLGLVAFEDHKAGTLRVTAEVVTLNPKPRRSNDDEDRLTQLVDDV